MAFVALFIFTCSWVVVNATVTINFDIHLESYDNVQNHTSATEIDYPVVFNFCVQPVLTRMHDRCPYGEISITSNHTTSFGHNNILQFREIAPVGDFQLLIEVYHQPLRQSKPNDVFAFKLPRCAPVHSGLYPYSLYTGMKNGRKLLVKYKVTMNVLSEACGTSEKHCQHKLVLNDVRLRRQSNDQGDDKFSSGIIVAIVIGVLLFVLYVLLFPAIVTLFIFCFMRCDCSCVKCCGFFYWLRCSSLKCVRKPRIGCPKSVIDTATLFCNKCCPCCSAIDTWDSGELGFWIEVVLLVILCFPFALCLIAFFAIAQK